LRPTGGWGRAKRDAQISLVLDWNNNKILSRTQLTEDKVKYRLKYMDYHCLEII
jgi:hypothetical protein